MCASDRDQELRFVVYDCPDYYQLKVSVFNDDKKTDLIGETWIDLRDIVVGGGGQSDQWHQLNFKGKYAGEIRIEITFYDSRPKPEKPVPVKPKQPAEADAATAYGSLPRAGPKRRPLPSDPVTGQAPASSAPDLVHQTPPRPQPNPPTSYIATQSPLQSIEYNSTPPPPVPARQHREIEHPPSAPPAAGGYSTPHRKEPSHLHHARSLDMRDKYPAEPEFSSPDYASHDYEHHDHVARNHHHQHHDDGLIPYHNNTNSSAPPRFDDSDPIPVDDDRPPPPPVHRSRNNSGGGHDVMFHNSFDTSPQKATPPTMRHDVLRNEAHRRSVPSTYPGQPTYKPYNPSVAPLATASSSNAASHYTTPEPEQPSPPRHHSYDSSFDSHPRHAHSALDDGPDSPTHYVQKSFRTSGSRMPSYDHDYNEPEFAKVPSPAPLNLTNRAKTGGSYHQDAMGMSNPRRQESSGYSTSPSPLATRDYRSTSPSPGMSAYDSYDPHSQWSELDDTHVGRPASSSYALPPVPSSLVPGVDPGLALELSSRIRDESRHHQRRHTTQNMATPPRGRQMMIEAPPPTYGQGSSPPASFGTPPHVSERSPISFSGGPSPAVTKPRALSPRPSHSTSPSPNPNHTIRRKSISPAPPPVEGRRLSGIPFGPDSFDALNPVVAAATKEAAKKDLSATNGKIIMYDGREVDPSDHLPQETWAPEPEPKAPSSSSSAAPSHHSHHGHHGHHHSLSGGGTTRLAGGGRCG